MKTPQPTPAKKPLFSTKFKVMATLLILGVSAFISSIYRVTTAAFTPVQFSDAQAIVERWRQVYVAKVR